MGAPHLHWLRATAVAALSGAVVGALAFAALFGLGEAGLAAIDFNAALFEDFLGPYWQTAEAIAGSASPDTSLEGGVGDARAACLPAPGYLYPAALACALAPFTVLGPSAASWLAVAMVSASILALLGAAFVLRPAPTWKSAALLGAAALLAQPVVHSIYWAQASLPVLALVAVGFAAASRGRSAVAGTCLGVAAAIKLYPLLFLLALFVRRDARALACSGVTMVIVGLVIPLIALGPADFVDFHREVAARLDAMARWVATPEGGRGSQDLAALAARWVGAGAAPFGRVAAFLLALPLLVVSIMRLRTGDWPGALPLLTAVPWLAVGPTWPHALAWLPLAWWFAAASQRPLVRTLTVLSFLTGSMFALRLLQPPTTFAWYGLPACSAALATTACLLSRPTQASP